MLIELFDHCIPYSLNTTCGVYLTHSAPTLKLMSSPARYPRRRWSRRWSDPASDAPRRRPATSAAAIRTRQTANWITLGTPLGLALALFGRAELRRGPHGLILAVGYRRNIPPVRGRAMTIGDVVLIGLDDEQLARRPHLITHEARHAGQWARWLGVPGFLPAYGLASAWSWLHTGDPALRNGFEIAADLIEGGYVRRPTQRPGPGRR